MKHVGILAIVLYLLYFGLALAADLKITWDPNTEEDLAGYNISYDGPTSTRWSTPCDPFQVSSIGVGYNTTYTIEGVTVGTYGIYIAAYDTMGNMSEHTTIAGTLTLVGEVLVWSTIGVDAPDSCVPDALFSLSTSTGTAYTMSISATDLSTGDPTSWLWSLWYPDNETVTPDVTYDTQNPTVYIPSPGAYSLRLRVWNSNWFDDYWNQNILLSSPPSPATQSGCVQSGGVTR